MYNLNKLIFGIIIDIKINLFSIRLMYDNLVYLSSIQAKTFTIIKKLNGNLKGLRRYPLWMITEDILKLQELMIDQTGQNMSYYKIRKCYTTTKYILYSNNLVCDGLDLNNERSFIIKNIMKDITNEISYDNYLTYDEIQKILKRNYDERK